MKYSVLDMMKFRIIGLVIYLLSLTFANAQIKDEKEFRVELNVYPEPAQLVILNLPKKAKRLRHYKEIDGKKESFESKFKYKKRWYSVEFNTNGILEDIEKTIKKRHLPEFVDLAIKSYLKSHSAKYDIIKIQEQYVYDAMISEEKFLNAVLLQGETMLPNYEIIVALKRDTTWSLQEMTFDSKGQYLSARQLQPDSYEYILY